MKKEEQKKLKFIQETFQKKQHKNEGQIRIRKNKNKKKKGKNTQLWVVKKADPQIIKQANIDKLIEYKKKNKLKSSVSTKIMSQK